jgi:hypothetical protein
MIEWKFTTIKATGRRGISRRGMKAERVERLISQNRGVTTRNLEVTLKLSVKLLLRKFNLYSVTIFNVGRRWGKCNQILETVFQRAGNVSVTLRRFWATIVAVDKQ